MHQNIRYLSNISIIRNTEKVHKQIKYQRTIILNCKSSNPIWFHNYTTYLKNNKNPTFDENYEYKDDSDRQSYKHFLPSISLGLLFASCYSKSQEETMKERDLILAAMVGNIERLEVSKSMKLIKVMS